ncbi:MAG: ABC transporter permease [Wenzhouxiangellaceae bacterium]|nr:ABC transporter permease [Wenzhouxiangellaceae bacterium]
MSAIKTVVASLQQQPLQALLTVLGMAFCIALFLCLSTLSLLFSSQIESIADTYRIDIAVQSRDAVTPMTSRIEPHLADEIERLESIDRVIQLSMDRLRLPWNPYSIVLGISEPEAFSEHLRLLDGALPASDSDEVLIGHQTAAQGYGVGQFIQLRDNARFRISGTFSSDIPFLNGALVLPLEGSRRISGRDGMISMLMIRVQPGTDVNELIDRINRQFDELRATPAGGLGREGLIVESANHLMWLISALAFCISVLLMSNMLVVSIIGRTREFGILAAVGWSRMDVARLVLLESLLVAGLGYACGLALAFLILAGLWWFDFAGASWWISARIPLQSMLLCAVVVLALSVLGAIYPAALATRKQTISALHHA